MPSGKVRFYNEDKGFGFIHGDGGEELSPPTSAAPAGAGVPAAPRLEYGVAEGKRGPQALSVRVLDAPRLAKRDRKSADEMALIIEDLVGLLDGLGERLKQGQYHERAQSRQLATMLRRVADDFDV